MAKKKAAKKATKRPVRKAAKKAGKKTTTRAVRKSASKAAKPAATPPSPVDLSKAYQQVYAPPSQATIDTVTLDHDVALHFRSSHAVNEALRALLRIVRQVRKP